MRLAEDLALIRLQYLRAEVIRLRTATKRYRKTRTKANYQRMREFEKLIDDILTDLEKDFSHD